MLDKEVQKVVEKVARALGPDDPHTAMIRGPVIPKTIKTPGGRTVSPIQYYAQVLLMFDPPHCCTGHSGCAAWERGPCSAELTLLDLAGEIVADDYGE